MTDSEINERVATEITKAKPRVRWCVLNTDESAMVIDFDAEREAREYFDAHEYLKQNYHVGPIKHWPDYSTDISAAMEVIEKMRERGFRWEARTPKGTGWQIRCFPTNVRGRGNQVFRGLLPRAICEAALKAVTK